MKEGIEKGHITNPKNSKPFVDKKRYLKTI
jgi:hypothetical protein